MRIRINTGPVVAGSVVVKNLLTTYGDDKVNIVWRL